MILLRSVRLQYLLCPPRGSVAPAALDKHKVKIEPIDVFILKKGDFRVILNVFGRNNLMLDLKHIIKIRETLKMSFLLVWTLVWPNSVKLIWSHTDDDGVRAECGPENPPFRRTQSHRRTPSVLQTPSDTLPLAPNETRPFLFFHFSVCRRNVWISEILIPFSLRKMESCWIQRSGIRNILTVFEPFCLAK